MKDPDDPDKDRGRSRTPGQTMTRAQIHRAARDKNKQARSGKYGNIGVNPSPGPSRNKHGDAGMTVGAMLRLPSPAALASPAIGNWRFWKKTEFPMIGTTWSFPGISWPSMADTLRRSNASSQAGSPRKSRPVMCARCMTS